MADTHPSRQGDGPSRRALLGAGAALPLGLVAGCRVRLEDDAPRVPGLPTREPTEDEGLLLAAWADATRLSRMSRAVGAPAAAAARLHTVHVATFDQELRDRRVPARDREAVASPTAAATPPGAALTGPAGLARLEGQAWSRDASAALGGAHVHRVALLASFATCRARLAGTMGAPVPWPAWSTAPTPADPVLVAAHREARYFLEVAAARTPPAEREPVLAQLRRVEGVVVRLQSRAGERTGATPASPDAAPDGAAPHAPATGASPGRPLPFPVTDEVAARRLVTHALRTLELGCGAAWPAAAGDLDAVTTVSRLVHDAVAAGAAWSVPLRPFPGLAP